MEMNPRRGCGLTTLGFTCGSNMPTGGCEVQAEQPSDPPAYPVRFKPLLDGTASTLAFVGNLKKLYGRAVVDDERHPDPRRRTVRRDQDLLTLKLPL